MNDDEHLDQRMRLVRPRFDFPVDFQREIWGRIEALDLETPRAWWAGWLRWLARPVPALALVLATGTLGCLLAEYSGRQKAVVLAETSYVKSVSPFAAANLGSGK